MTDQIADREAEAAFLRDQDAVKSATTVRQIYMLGVERGKQIERDRATLEKIDFTLARLRKMGVTDISKLRSTY